MARSTKGSNQRPDTLMQDRTSANSMKVLLQRTAHAAREMSAFAPIAVKDWHRSETSLRAKNGLMRRSKKVSLFDHLVGAGLQR
jgi:hypothetical protein